MSLTFFCFGQIEMLYEGLCFISSFLALVACIAADLLQVDLFACFWFGTADHFGAPPPAMY